MSANQTVSDDVLRMIEEKRQKAIALRKRKMEEQKSTVQNSSNSHFHSPPKNPRINSTNVIKNNFTAIKNLQTSTVSNTVAVSNNTTKQSTQMQISSQNEKNVVSPKNEKSQIKVSFNLESSNRFGIIVEYNSDIVKIFRNIDSKKWDPITKNWSFAIKDYKTILSELKSIKHLDLKYVDTIPQNVLEALSDINTQKVEIDLSERLNSDFVESLFNYQREGIIFGIQHQGRCLIADDMGLGKTLQAIGLAIWYKEDWPLLIVCPSSLRYQWMKSLLRWISDLSEKDVHVVTNTKDSFSKVPITITSYDLMSRLKNRFTVENNRFYSMIIMDESHYIKSDSSQRTSVALLIAKSCKRVVLLSGTPALSRPIGMILFI